MNSLKTKKVFFGLCFCFCFSYLITGCAMVKDIKLKTSVVREDLPEKAPKGYVSFEFPSSKTGGEAAFDVAVNVAVAAFAGGGKPPEDKLEVSKKTDVKEEPMFWLQTYNLENVAMYGPEYNFRWAAEEPGTYSYQVTFLKRWFEIPFCYVHDERVPFCDVTVDVQEGMITPVTVYYMDFYDERGKPKKAGIKEGDAEDSPTLDMGEEKVMGEERYRIGEPYPVSEEKMEPFLDNKEE